MSKLLIFVSATIVLFSVSGWASPVEYVPEDTEDQVAWPTAKPDENLSISEPAPSTKPPPAIDSGYYSYRQVFTFRIGQAADLSDTNNQETIFGFQYLFPKFLSPKVEAGADVHENGRGHVHVGVRYYFWERSYFRPSYKIGASHMVDAKENLATFTQLENYYLRLSGTLEYVVSNPYSIRLEPEFLLGTAKMYVVVTLGISRGW